MKLFDVRIYYPGKIQEDLDDAARDLGLDNWAAGYNYVDDVRDLAFDNVPDDKLFSLLAVLGHNQDSVAHIRLIGDSTP
jgi:hypothetical protein